MANTVRITVVMLVVLWLCCGRVAVAAEVIPAAVRSVVVQAQRLMEQQHYRQALAVLEARARRANHHYLIDFTLGNLHLLQRHYHRAEEYYRQVVAARPQLAEAWLNLAQCHYMQADYPAAAQAFERAYALSKPAEPRWRYNAAAAWLQAQQPQRAVALLQQLRRDYPQRQRNDWLAALVQGYLQLEQPRQALEPLRYLCRHSSGDEQRRWRELLVQQYLDLAELVTAHKAVNRYLDDDPLWPQWWRLATHIYLERNDYPHALVTLKVLGYLRPLNDEETALLANLYLSLGVPRQAREYYRRLSAAHPDDATLLTRLAYASLNLHQPQQALEWADKALAHTRKKPARARLLQLAGQLLFSLGRYAEACKTYAELARCGDDPGAAYLMQGYAAWNGRLWRQARSALEQAARYRQQRDRAHKLLKQLPAAARVD